MEQKHKMPLWVGIVAFAACIQWQILAALILPPDIGLYGSLMLEIGLLVLAILPVLIMRIPLREVFPFKKPKWNHLVAIPVLYYASAYLVGMITYLTGLIFPEQMLGVMDYIGEATTSVPGWVAFMIMAFAAPLCEEPFHRGLIQYSTGRIKSTAWRLIFIGIIFGVFHLEPYRFFITGALGVLLAYIMYETENLLIPMLFHFVNNAVSALSSTFNPDALSAIDAAMFSPGSVGMLLLVYGTVGPFILYGGVRLLTLKNSRSSGKPFPHKKFLLIAAIIAAVSFIAGSLLVIFGMDDVVQAMDMALQNI